MTQPNPLQVTFKGIPHDDALQAEIEAQFVHLAQFGRVHGGRVVVRADEKHHQHGRRYQVKVHVHVPGKELIAGKHPSRPGHTDGLLAVRDAFQAVERQLRDHTEKLQGRVHAPRPLSAE